MEGPVDFAAPAVIADLVGASLGSQGLGLAASEQGLTEGRRARIFSWRVTREPRRGVRSSMPTGFSGEPSPTFQRFDLVNITYNI
jgi:hypothetical protein